MDMNMDNDNKQQVQADVNCNDVIRVEVKVNNHLFFIQETACNTQREFNAAATRFSKVLKSFKLERLSKFGVDI